MIASSVFGYDINDGADNDIFTRESNLSVSNNENYMIIGCGGIGSWVSKLVGSLRGVRNIILIDPDVIEQSNLNRTPFNMDDVGEYKVQVLANQISTKNPTNVRVYPFRRYFDKYIAAEFKENMNNIFNDISAIEKPLSIIDCRDDFYDDYSLFKKFSNKVELLRAAYNGTSVTIDLNPWERPVMGSRGYSIQPSHIIPSILSATMIVLASCQYKELKKKKNIYNVPMTFDIFNLFDTLHIGNYVMEGIANSKENCVAINEEWLKKEF